VELEISSVELADRADIRRESSGIRYTFHTSLGGGLAFFDV
jgi:hypothetical protein